MYKGQNRKTDPSNDRKRFKRKKSQAKCKFNQLQNDFKNEETKSKQKNNEIKDRRRIKTSIEKYNVVEVNKQVEIYSHYYYLPQKIVKKNKKSNSKSKSKSRNKIKSGNKNKENKVKTKQKKNEHKFQQYPILQRENRKIISNQKVEKSEQRPKTLSSKKKLPQILKPKVKNPFQRRMKLQDNFAGQSSILPPPGISYYHQLVNQQKTYVYEYEELMKSIEVQ